ncbi:hypothetical protein UlMin_035569 [Ulmus minor]
MFNRDCFGEPITVAETSKQWFQLGMDEAFYICYSLKCLKILWRSKRSKKELVPVFYKAYSHLRTKNWVVMSGVRYGVDFVAYLHCPALVHSELKMWSNVHCTTRLYSDKFSVEEHFIRRWRPEKCQEDHGVVDSDKKN